MFDADGTPLPLHDLRPDLHGRRAVVYGVAGDLARAIVEALRVSGAEVALTSASTDGAALFALKRAAAGAPAQAVDLANPTNVRVATRKLAKELGGLDVAVLVPPAQLDPRDLLAIAARETRRGGGAGTVILIGPLPRGNLPDSLVAIDAPDAPAGEIATLVTHLAAAREPSAAARACTIRDGLAVPIDPAP